MKIIFASIKLMLTFVVLAVKSATKNMNYSITQIETIQPTDISEGYTEITIEGNNITEAMISKAFNETGADILVF